jgi:hypothetical protein
MVTKCTCEDAGRGLWIEDGCEEHDHSIVNERAIEKLVAAGIEKDLAYASLEKQIQNLMVRMQQKGLYLDL